MEIQSCRMFEKIKRRGYTCNFCFFFFVVTYYYIVFEHAVAFHIETSHLIWTRNQMAGLCMKFNLGFKWFNPLSVNFTKWSNTLKQLVGCCRRIV